MRTHRSANAFAFRGPDRGLDDLHPFGPEDLVEKTGELGIPVADEEPDALKPLPHSLVASLLSDPRRVGVCSDAEDVHPRGPDLDREEHVQRAKPRRLHSEEVEGQDPLSLGAKELVPGGTGSPWSRAQSVRSQEVRILVAETLTPSLASSPRIRMHPHLGFSLPIRRMSLRNSALIGGLPPEKMRPKVHFLRTKSRCHRRSVCGLTRNDDHRARERTLPSAAMNNRSRRRSRGLPTWRLRTISW